MKTRRLPAPRSGEESSLRQTGRIQAAIDQVAGQGGGTVYLGEGQWRTTTLFLRSGVRLHLEQGCVLLAETDLTLYPPQLNHAHNKDQSSYHLIYADGCEDIALEGEGIIDGQDTEFWTPAATEEERPYGIFDFYATGDRPSPLIQIVHCQQVRLEGLTIRRSPGWTVHTFDCDEVHISRLRLRNHLMGPNADGININGCRNVFVRECDVVTGDDAICIKATNQDVPCKNVVVSDCIVETNCGAFALGAETWGGISNVTFSNCIARASLRLIAIEMWDPGDVHNVIFTNIAGATLPSPRVYCERPIYLDIQQFLRPEPELGRMRNIIISKVACTTRGRIVLTAQDGSEIKNVLLRDIQLDVPEIEDPQEVVPAARSWQNSNFNPETRAVRAAVVVDNVTGLNLSGLSVTWPENAEVPMHGLYMRHVHEAVVNSPHLRPSQKGLAPIVNWDERR